MSLLKSFDSFVCNTNNRNVNIYSLKAVLSAVALKSGSRSYILKYDTAALRLMPNAFVSHNQLHCATYDYDY